MDPHDIERRLLNKRSCDPSSSTPPSSKRSTNRDEVNDKSSSRESSISSKRQDRRQHKRQRTDEEDNSDYDDNITSSITKRQPPRSHDIELESHDQSTRPRGKKPAGGKPYRRKGRPDINIVPNTKRSEQSCIEPSSTQYMRQERRQHKRQRTDEEDNSDYDDNITSSITKRQPPRSHDIELESHDQSIKLHEKEPARGRPYKRKRRPDSVTTSQIPIISLVVSILLCYDICTDYYCIC